MQMWTFRTAGKLSIRKYVAASLASDSRRHVWSRRTSPSTPTWRHALQSDAPSSRPESMWRVEEHRGPEALNSLIGEWRGLEPSCRTATPFQSPEWLIPGGLASPTMSSG